MISWEIIRLLLEPSTNHPLSLALACWCQHKPWDTMLTKLSWETSTGEWAFWPLQRGITQALSFSHVRNNPEFWPLSLPSAFSQSVFASPSTLYPFSLPSFLLQKCFSISYITSTFSGTEILRLWPFSLCLFFFHFLTQPVCSSVTGIFFPLLFVLGMSFMTTQGKGWFNYTCS